MLAFSVIRNGVGSIIRVHRIDRGLSQSDLAERMGVTSQMIVRYEKGYNNISIPKLLQIASILNTTPEQLLSEAVSPIKETSGKEEYMIAKLFKQLSTKEKEAITNCVRILIGNKELPANQSVA